MNAPVENDAAKHRGWISGDLGDPGIVRVDKARMCMHGSADWFELLDEDKDVAVGAGVAAAGVRQLPRRNVVPLAATARLLIPGGALPAMNPHAVKRVTVPPGAIA